VQEVFNVIPDFNTYSPDEKKIAEYLGLEVLIKDAQRKLEMANRDLYNLNNEPDTQSILAKREKIYNDIDVVKDATPLSISVTDKADFVKYPNEEELQDLFDQYLELNNLELSKREKKALNEKNNLLQKKVSIRTTAYYVEIQYISGRTEEVTLISRAISTDETAPDIKYVEFVPKDLVESTDDIIFVNQPDKILQKDPVFEIQLNKIKEFVYYVKEKIELDNIPKIDIAVLSTEITEKDQITGFAVFDNLGFSESNTKIFMIQVFVVFILLGVYLFFYFRSNASFTLPKLKLKQRHNELTTKKPEPIINKPQETKVALLTNKHDLSASEQHKIDYMNKVIQKAHGMININLEKSALYYHEVKFLYELLPENDKEIVYEKVIGLADEINFKHVQKLADEAVIELAHNNMDNAYELYENIQLEFEKLPNQYKEQIYKKCCEIALHLK
jgi:hypothetical protein